MKFKEGKVALETLYFADPFEPPEWRFLGGRENVGISARTAKTFEMHQRRHHD